jgi:VWFA-related protein
MKRAYIFLFILIGVLSAPAADNSAQFDILVPGKTVMPVISRSLVMIEARVTDKDGNPVHGLKAEDFRLYQDGKRQEITEFHEIERAKDGTEPRIIVFVVDDLSLPGKKYDQVRTAIGSFAHTAMQPTDMVGIARTAGGGVVFQPLTSDAAELQASMDQWQCSIETARPFENVILATGTSSASFIQSCSGSS